MGRVDDVSEARCLTGVAQNMRSSVSAFAEAVSKDHINYRIEAKNEASSSAAVADFERALDATYVGADKMEVQDKNLCDGIRHHARAIADDFAIDVILHQRAKIKFNARRRHYDSRPAVERVLCSPRAKVEDVFRKEQDPRFPFAGATQDGVLPAEPRKDKTSELGMSAGHIPTLLFASILIALATVIAFIGSGGASDRERTVDVAPAAVEAAQMCQASTGGAVYVQFFAERTQLYSCPR